MHPASPLLVLCLVAMLFHATVADMFKFLRYFEVEKVDTDTLVNQFQDRDAAATSPKDFITEPVISPKDAAYRLSYANYDMTWKQFKLDHNRSYESAREEHKRFAIFMENVKEIERHNWQFHNGLTTYWMDINQFSDWTSEEWLAMMPTIKVNNSVTWEDIQVHDGDSMSDVPPSIDWRTQGVKSQGLCGSCWAFSTTGSLEGQWFKKTRNLISLSEQQLVDCSRSFGNLGCSGGYVDKSFNYIAAAGGIESEADYPYTAQDSSCKFQKAKVKAKVTGFRDVTPRGSETALKNIVGTVGPVSVCIAVTSNFQKYKGGIFIDNTCRGIDHCVLAVGYGSSGGQDYWTVKNSWGTAWGSSGYIFMARNRGNMCEIATMASYPTV